MALLDRLRDLVHRSRVQSSPSARQAARLLRSPTALMQLTQGEAITVVSLMQPEVYPKGTTIIRQGDEHQNDFMVLVLEGEVTVESITVSRTQPLTLNVIGPGGLIGEMSLLDGAARSASCTASTDVHGAMLTREALETLIRQHPPTAAKLLIAVTQRLTERMRANSDKLRLYSQLVLTMQHEIEQLQASLRQR